MKNTKEQAREVLDRFLLARGPMWGYADDFIDALDVAGLLNKLPTEEEFEAAVGEFSYSETIPREGHFRYGARWAYDFIRNYGRGRR